MDEVKERALSDDERPVRRGAGSCRTLRQYAEGSPSIHVAPVVTTLKEPKLYIPPPDTSVVEALLAATAVVPFFKPVEFEVGRLRIESLHRRRQCRQRADSGLSGLSP